MTTLLFLMTRKNVFYLHLTINNEVMACNPRCNGFNVLCSICWFSFLLWCYDHLCVVTRCEYIHIWEEKQKKQTNNWEKKENINNFSLWWRCCCCCFVVGEKAGTWPSCKPAPLADGGVIIRPRLAWLGPQVRGLGLVQRELPCSSSNGRWEYWITSSASPSLLLFMCSQDFNCKDKRKEKKNKKKTTLYFESAIPPKIRDLFLYGLL